MSKQQFKSLMSAYGYFIAAHPFIILGIALLLTAVAAQLQSTLELMPHDDRDFLPEDRPVVVALDKIGDEFGGLRTLTVAVEVDPTVAGSNEARDILDPRLIAYAWTMHERIRVIKEVSSVSSGAGLLKEGNGGVLPKSVERGQELWDANPSLSQYLSGDHTLLLVRADILPDVDNNNVYNQFDSILSDTERPPGVSSFMVGSIPEDVELNRLISPDMARVMQYSFMGILVVVLIVMGSLAYGILPLFTILFGTTWSMGMWAALGRDLTMNTSGVSSMIMGIGIDFGIQSINRFRQELARLGSPEQALAETLANVAYPMSTTTIAALIGFRAMSMGELTALSDMAGIMSLGVLGCFMAALTILPALVIIHLRYVQPPFSRYFNRRKFKEVLLK